MLPGSLASAVATLLGGALADRLRPKIVAVGFLLGGAWATWVFRTDYFDPKSQVVWDNLMWGFAISGAFAPVSYMIFAVLKEEHYSHGTMLINVTRLVAGSIGTALSTNLLTSRQNSFYDAISWRMDWGFESGMGLLSSMEALAGLGREGVEVARRLIYSVASGEAFMATYKHLALWLLGAAIALVFARHVKARGRAPVH
jgi:DHA2 family multidrug resistance protein